MSSTARPCLGEHVLPRRHVIAGRTQVVLNDLARDSRIVLGKREWMVLELADGTRDLEGIRLALAAGGVRVEPAMLATFFASLHDEGVLADGGQDIGEATAAPSALVTSAPGEPTAQAISLDCGAAGTHDGDAASRPVRVLPGYSFTCDARGACCGLYPTILFTPHDLVRARAAMPDVLDGGHEARHVSTPNCGGVRPSGLYAGAFVDGRCAYQRSDGLCGIHARQGEHAKPDGCRLYPLTFVDDGESVRVSLVCECACAYRSARATATGAPLLDPTITRRDQIEPAALVDRVPPQIAITSSRVVASDTLPAWSMAVCEAHAPLGPRAMLALADSLERHGLDASAASVALADPARSFDASALLGKRVEELGRVATRRAREDATFCPSDSIVGVGMAAVAGGATALQSEIYLETALDDDTVPTTTHDDERFYVRAIAFGHQWLGRRPLADAIRERAARMLVARAVTLGLAGVPEMEHPLGRIEAIVRTHGLT